MKRLCTYLADLLLNTRDAAVDLFRCCFCADHLPDAETDGIHVGYLDDRDTRPLPTRSYP